MPGLHADGFLLLIHIRGEKGHRPHVHVEKAEHQCTILLDDALTPYDVFMRPPDVARARRLVSANRLRLQEWWDLYNG